MATRIYHYLGQKQLRDWLHVEIDEDEDGVKRITFVSRWHVGNRFPISWCYGKDYTDEEILRDGNLAGKCTEMFGPDWWVGSIRI